MKTKKTTKEELKKLDKKAKILLSISIILWILCLGGVIYNLKSRQSNILLQFIPLYLSISAYGFSQAFILKDLEIKL